MPGSPYLFQSGAAASFDSLAPTTTKGDVIVHNGSVNVRQAVGSNGQIITADSAQTTGIKWATPGNRAVRSVTSTDTVLTTDDVNLLSSTSFTSTLFAGSGNTGKPVTFIHDGTSLTGIYTIARAGSDPIGPNSVASLKLYMKGEALTLMWNGTYWEILSWTFPSVPVNYTPTFQGGTGGGGNVNVSYYATRISQCHLLTQGSHTLGTQAGTEMRVGLLGGLTSSANYLASGTMLGLQEQIQIRQTTLASLLNRQWLMLTSQ